MSAVNAEAREFVNTGVEKHGALSAAVQKSALTCEEGANVLFAKVRVCAHMASAKTSARGARTKSTT